MEAILSRPQCVNRGIHRAWQLQKHPLNTPKPKTCQNRSYSSSILALVACLQDQIPKFQWTKYTTHLALTAKLWRVYHIWFGDKWPRGIKTSQYLRFQYGIGIVSIDTGQLNCNWIQLVIPVARLFMGSMSLHLTLDHWPNNLYKTNSYFVHQISSFASCYKHTDCDFHWYEFHRKLTDKLLVH